LSGQALLLPPVCSEFSANGKLLLTILFSYEIADALIDEGFCPWINSGRKALPEADL
jgi:hypothetical protein